MKRSDVNGREIPPRELGLLARMMGVVDILEADLSHEGLRAARLIRDALTGHGTPWEPR